MYRHVHSYKSECLANFLWETLVHVVINCQRYRLIKHGPVFFLNALYVQHWKHSLVSNFFYRGILQTLIVVVKPAIVNTLK